MRVTLEFDGDLLAASQTPAVMLLETGPHHSARPIRLDTREFEGGRLFVVLNDGPAFMVSASTAADLPALLRAVNARTAAQAVSEKKETV